MVRIFSVEGNIGSGKSTLIQHLKEHYKNRTDIVFIDEPVHLWDTISDENNKTILAHFYENSSRWGFSFQIMAYISRLAEMRKVIRKYPQSTIISERCLLTDRHVFAKMLYDDKKIHSIDYQIYLKWFDEFLDDIKMTGHIYLNASAQKCFERVIKRNREGEKIPIEYLEKCHTYHMDWLKNRKDILELDGNQEETKNVIQDWIREIAKFASLNEKNGNDIFREILEKGYGC